MIVHVPSSSEDIYFMSHALNQAQKAFDSGEIPIGSIVVQDDIIIGSGYNQTETKHSQMYHAEMIALNHACMRTKDWRLENATIYVTLQPCMMCFGYIALSRVSRIVYGAPSKLFGYDLDCDHIPVLYQKHIKSMTTHVCADESEYMLKLFFKKRRNRE
jgi:tRNA(adenine34) deaminase